MIQHKRTRALNQIARAASEVTDIYRHNLNVHVNAADPAVLRAADSQLALAMGTLETSVRVWLDELTPSARAEFEGRDYLPPMGDLRGGR